MRQARGDTSEVTQAGRWRGRLLVAAVVCGLALAAGLSSCGKPEDQSLCTVYADYVATADEIAKADATKATAAEVSATIDDALLQVQHLGEVADSRYSEPIEALKTSLEDTRRVLESVEPDADYATWQPLVADSVSEAKTQAVRVSEAIEPSCSSGS